MAFGFSLSHKTKDVKREWGNLTTLGTDTFNAGNKLADAEVNTLRGYSDVYSGRLKDPLGPEGRGIFSRARGSLSDAATQRGGAFSSRLSQAMLTSNLSPEAKAQLEAENQRSINEDLFKGNVDVSNAEAAMTLTETSKLFDRMEGISRTILGVGVDRSNVGLNALIQSILGRQALAFGKTAAATAMVGTAVSAGAVAGSAGKSGGSTANPYTGQG